MRLLRYTLLFMSFVLVLSSCYEITEEVSIEPSGKGVYTTSMDMGQMLSMLKSFAQSDSMKEAMDKVIDTTINFKSFTDTATNIDAATKALVEKGTLHFVMKADSNVFKFGIRLPFHNLQQLQSLQEYLNKSGGGMQSLGKMFNPGKVSDDQQDKGLPSEKITTVLHTTWTASSISRTFDKPAYDKLMKDTSLQQVKEMSAMMGDMKYTTIIHLPRPAKKVESKQSKLSDDRKTVTLAFNLMDIFDTPEEFIYKIDY